MSDSTQNFVQLQNIHFSREGRAIFHDLSLTIPKGKVTVILGPSGTGKTTLLKLMCGQLKPDLGSIVLDSDHLADLSRKALLKVRKRLSLLFQSGALFTDMSVFDNVAFPLREHTKLSESMVRDLVLIRLESVGLRGAAQLMPSELSGGMARRVALARSLALDPELIMYDEPFTGQDPISMGVIMKLIRQVHEDLKLTTVLVSHDVPEALSLADHVYVLAKGEVVASGSPDQLSQSSDPFVQQFLYAKGDAAVPFHYPAEPFVNQVMQHD
ncbi:ATP-binding cassette domain-containing protein [Oceaniserpentilla sp. 4NH20-0058]|uniref:ABC transporter ATP-binding protein n=1 Tax=Oceaniserpentilla sp. 4NH20-0058 TaxID=3127660 RepID=UPI003340C13A